MRYPSGHQECASFTDNPLRRDRDKFTSIGLQPGLGPLMGGIVPIPLGIKPAGVDEYLSAWKEGRNRPLAAPYLT